MGRSPVSALLPEFPWDALEPLAERARRHPDGLIDLSMGTPTDSVPYRIRQALRRADDAPGYPPTGGSPELRTAIVDYLVRTCNAHALTARAVLPTIGSKELVASLPSALGLGEGDVIAIPHLAYPTYEVGARLAGARVVRAETSEELLAARPSLIWINSPSNPTGALLSAPELRVLVRLGRELGALVVSDECYLPLCPPGTQTASILDPEVCGQSHEGILAVHSLSKRSNLAGYRAGFVAGDPAVVAELLAVRKHSGLIVPTPVQSAMIAALADEDHAEAQTVTYGARRNLLMRALRGVGFHLERARVPFYLWATRLEDCWASAEYLARYGILVSPGEIYGPRGARHVRIALTAASPRIREAKARLLVARREAQR
jgi:succinyldiaminopimelate transaminase